MRFSYTATANQPDSLMPRLPFVLHYRARSAEVTGLLDTGSTVNILPHRVGLALGAVWEECLTPVPLVGSLGRFEARALIVRGTQPQLLAHSPVRLVFAWTQSDDAPVIFGQMNFFLEFDVCFYRSQNVFDVHPRARG